MKTMEEKDRKAVERVLNAKTPEERIKMAIKNFKKENQICSAILYLAPEVVDEGKSSILIDTINDDYSLLQGQIVMDMMSNVHTRNFLMDTVDMYRENRCPDDIIEDAFFWCNMHDKWCELSEEKDAAALIDMRCIANNNQYSDNEKYDRLRIYILKTFVDGKEGEK